MSYCQRYRCIYARLKEFGFSPFIALWILVDAKCGDRFALNAIRTAKNFRRRYT